MTYTHLSTSALVVVVVLAPALGLIACGDSDNDNASAGDTRPTETVSTNPAADRKSVRDAMRALQDAFYSGDGDTWCDGVTAHAATETARQAESATCVDAIQTAVPEPLPPQKVQQFRSKIVKIDLSGDRATITTKQSKQPRLKVPFVREDGEWKLNAGLSPS